MPPSRALASLALAALALAHPATAAQRPPPLGAEAIPTTPPPARRAPTVAYDDERSFDKDWARRFYLYDLAGFLAQAATADLLDSIPTPEAVNRAAAEGRPGEFGPLPRDPSCGCAFTATGRLADPTHCEGMRGVGDEAAARERPLLVVDPRLVAAPLACYRKGSCEIDGVEFGGVTCCTRQDGSFAGAMRDSHFYVLAPQPLVEATAGLSPGAATPGSPELCGFAIDRERGVFSLPSRLNGAVARAWLYAAKHYGTRPPATLAALAALSSQSPADRFEVARERLTRARFNAPMTTLDGVLKGVPVSAGLRQLGVSE